MLPDVGVVSGSASWPRLSGPRGGGDRAVEEMTDPKCPTLPGPCWVPGGLGMLPPIS